MKEKIQKHWPKLVILLLVTAIVLFTYFVDRSFVNAGKEPIYCAKVYTSYSNKITYWGLGYKVIRYTSDSPKEPFENSIGVKMGSWFMDYELPDDQSNSEQPIKRMKNLDEFYQTELTKNKDIRNLSSEYRLLDAVKDSCLAIDSTVHNIHLYDEFMENVRNHNSAFIRIADTTANGNLFLQDLLYDADSETFYLVEDHTRDYDAPKEHRQITMNHFNHLEENTVGKERFLIVYQYPMDKDNLFDSMKRVVVLK